MPERSFISEHSAEYLLVPKLCAILEPDFSSTLPIYYWATREGSRLSLESRFDALIQIVACFARRPKVSYAGQDCILVKFNEMLFEYATAASGNGIPVLAGVPLVSSLSQLTSNRESAWFEIVGEDHKLDDAWCRLAIPDGTIIDKSDPSHVIGPLTPDQLRKLVNEQAELMLWSDAAELIRRLRRMKRGWGPYSWMGNYHPFHLLLIT